MEKSIGPKLKIIWGTIGLFVREINLTSTEIAFFRAFIGSGFLIIISLITKDKVNKEVLKENLPIIFSIN